jgi:D-threonate/D-erythronate kinase
MAAVPLDPYKLIIGEQERKIEMENCFRLAVSALDSERDVALFISSTHADVPMVQALGRSKGMENVEVATRIVDTLGFLIRKISEKYELGGIILSGGDTVRAVCASLEAANIEILQEVEPGIPICRLNGLIKLPIVTKAGAFGSQKVLIDALELLKKV